MKNVTGAIRWTIDVFSVGDQTNDKCYLGTLWQHYLMKPSEVASHGCKNLWNDWKKTVKWLENQCHCFTTSRKSVEISQWVLFCEARRASHCHSPQTTYSSKSTCCAISAQNSAMHVVVYVDRLTSQRSIVEIINWCWSYWQILYPGRRHECFWKSGACIHCRLVHRAVFCDNIHGGK